MTDVKITKLTDHPDGSATLEMEMDEAVLLFLAKVGMLHLIEEEARRTLDGHPDTEGTDNPPTRGEGAEHLFGEISEL